MKIQLVGITSSERRLRAEPTFALVESYLNRASQYESCSFAAYPTEAAMLTGTLRLSGRSRAYLLLLDGGGKLMKSQEFATRLGALRDTGRQDVVLAIGPASGWSSDALSRADLLLSLGPMTLPHALAQVVVAEQIYRALTILAGHPYHCGH